MHLMIIRTTRLLIMSQLIVKNIHLQQIQFRINPDFHIENENQAVEIKHSIAIKCEHKEKSLIVHVAIQTPPADQAGNYPFYFSLAVSGYFELKEDVEKPMLDQFININCPAIIFPYLRETLADITRRSGFPPMHLQPVNFVKLHKEKADGCNHNK